MNRSVTRVDKSLNQDLKNFGCDMTEQLSTTTGHVAAAEGCVRLRSRR
jgi:hypothetical protein